MRRRSSATSCSRKRLGDTGRNLIAGNSPAIAIRVTVCRETPSSRAVSVTESVAGSAVKTGGTV